MARVEPRLEFVRRLGDEWRDLAVVLAIEDHVQQRFQPGYEGHDIWAYLVRRNRLAELPTALRVAGRGDLADAVEVHCLTVASRIDAGIATAVSPIAELARVGVGPLDLGRPAGWVMGGPEGEAGTRGHFTRRALGQRGYAPRGDLFRGRQTALAVVSAWLTAAEPPGRVLVVTGQPGAGKSAVVARMVLDERSVLDTTGTGRRGLAFHARNAVLSDLVTAVARAVGTETADSVPGVIDCLRERDGILAVVVDALDEAATDNDRDALVHALTDMATPPQVRVVVATRALAPGRRFTPGGLFATLGVRSARDANLVDLDSDVYFDPPAAAWTSYRADRGLCDRMAAVVAARAGRNHLVAALTADQLAHAETTLDPAAPGFDPAAVPATVGEALTKYLYQRQPTEREQIRGLLTVLAYARGPGLDDAHWLSFAAALGYQATTTDLDVLRHSSAADYLLQTAQHAGATLTRLFHQALADELLTARDQHSYDEQRLLGAVVPHSPRGWAAADEYARRYAADHAAAGGLLDDLLVDPVYPTVADLDRLVPLLPAAPPSDLARIVMIVRSAAHRAQPLPSDRRIGLYELTAAHLGLPWAGTGPASLGLVWAHAVVARHLTITSHAREVNAVAVGRVGDRDVIISGSHDTTVRVWDALTGGSLGDPLAGHTREVNAVALGRIGGRDVIVSGSEDRTVRLWDATTGRPVGSPLTGHTSGVMAVAIGRIGDRDAIVSCSSDDSVRIWSATTGQPLGQPLIGHTSGVRAVALGRVGDHDVVVSGSADRTVSVWDAVAGRTLAGPLRGHADTVMAVALGRIGDHDVIVSGGYDRTVRVWDAATGQPFGEPLTAHTDTVMAVAIGQVGDRDVIVSASHDDTVRVWDAATSQPVGEPLPHPNTVRAVALGRVSGRDVIVSGGYDRSVRIWDAATGQPIGEPLGHADAATGTRVGSRPRSADPVRVRDATGCEPLAGHTDTVRAVALGRVGDRGVIVSGSDDRTVRIWDAATGGPLGQPLTGHTSGVIAVALGRIGDRDVIVSGSYDRTVRIWDAATGRCLSNPLIGHTDAVMTVALGRIGDDDVVVSGGTDATVRVWSTTTGDLLGEPLTGHTKRVRAVALGRIGDRVIIISGSTDTTIRLWDAANRQPLGPPLAGHTSTVRAVATGRIGDRDLIVSGSADTTVRIWDPATGVPLGEPLAGHTNRVSAVALGRFDDRDVIISGSRDATVRIWEPKTRNTLAIQDTLDPVTAAAATSNDIAIAAGRAIIVLTATSQVHHPADQLSAG